MQSDGFPKALPGDDTKYRILGDTNYQLPKTENYQYFIGHSATERAATKQTKWRK